MIAERPLGGFRGLPGALLLCGALAGCGSVVASSGAAVPPASAAPQAGCAGVNQATAVNIRRSLRLMAPVGTNPVSTSTYRHAAQVRALFGQLCAAVTHPSRPLVMNCPADIGTEFLGTFYDGSRVLATFTYVASGCERVSVSAAGKTLSTLVYGRAAAAAPQLSTDLDVIVGAPRPGEMQPLSSGERA